MAGCIVKHDNPYCSTQYPKIRVDVAYERERLERLAVLYRKHGGGYWRQMQDSRDRLQAARIGCVIPVGKGARSR